MLGLSEGVMKLALDARHFVSNIIMSPNRMGGGDILLLVQILSASA